ncbi:MAG: PepSY-like domain-containing protein [Prevotella sp.]|nr:PepSY-like domain-containing protein [Prevotella sp.]
MTQKRFFLAALMCLIMSATTFATDKVILASQLPAAAQTFVKETFPDANIIFAEKDGWKYEVRLNDGTEIDFDKKGDWDKVDCEFKAVPAQLIPEAIANSVEAQFPGAMITKIDKERHGYDIELSNGFDLKFDRQFRIIEFDD